MTFNCFSLVHKDGSKFACVCGYKDAKVYIKDCRKKYRDLLHAGEGKDKPIHAYLYDSYIKQIETCEIDDLDEWRKHRKEVLTRLKKEGYTIDEDQLKVERFSAKAYYEAHKDKMIAQIAKAKKRRENLKKRTL